MRRGEPAPSDEVLILLATAGAHRLVLRAGDIDAVSELDGLAHLPLDVPRVLGLAAAPGERAVRLSSGRWLHLGSHLVLRNVAASSFTPLPVWLPTQCHALPLAGAVDLSDGFGFEVDAALIDAMGLEP